MRTSRVLTVFGAFLISGGLNAQALPLESRLGQTPEPPGPLSAAHSENPGIKNCFFCHTEEFEAAPEKCLSCHKEIALRLFAGRGFHQGKSVGCGACHAEHGGQEKSLIPLEPEKFDHEETGFPLKGVHQEITPCFKCHSDIRSFPRKHGRSYLLTGTGCLFCHQSPHPGRQDDCLSCHDFDGWRVGLATISGKNGR